VRWPIAGYFLGVRVSRSRAAANRQKTGWRATDIRPEPETIKQARLRLERNVSLADISITTNCVKSVEGCVASDADFFGFGRARAPTGSSRHPQKPAACFTVEAYGQYT
jgi:hypothetical protein